MATKCTTTNNLYDDVLHCPGEISLPGVREHGYYIRRTDIIKWPPIPMNAAASLEGNPVYTVDFSLAADAKWHKFDLIPGESEAKTEQTGVYGSYHFNNTIKLVLPGTGKHVTGFINELNNDDVVFAIPQRDGQIRIFGNEDFQTTIKPSQEWGKSSSDSNNTAIEVIDENKSATPFYTGILVTEDGNIDGATDTLKTASSGS